MDNEIVRTEFISGVREYNFFEVKQFAHACTLFEFDLLVFQKTYVAGDI